MSEDQSVHPSKGYDKSPLQILAMQIDELKRMNGTSGLSESDKLICSCLPLAIKLAKTHRRKCGRIGLEMEDLVQECCVGLCDEAIRKYDPERGNKFSSYATGWMRQKMSKASYDHGPIIRASPEIQNNWRKLRDLCAEGLGIEDAGKQLGLSPAKTVIAYGWGIMTSNVISMDAPQSREAATSYGESIPDISSQSPEALIIQQSSIDQLNAWLNKLDIRDADILRRRFGIAPYTEEQTFREIGQVIGLTHSRVEQLEKMALTQLRRFAKKAKRPPVNAKGRP